MANNYTHFSFAFQINSPAEAEYLETILQAAHGYDESDENLALAREVFGSQFDYYGCLGFDYEIECGSEGGEVWIHDDGGEGNADHAVSLVQAYLNKFDLDTKIGFSWAFTCSSPRIGEFGGGAVVVTKDDEKWMNTDQWLSENGIK
jgi:hypothetical protein